MRCPECGSDVLSSELLPKPLIPYTQSRFRTCVNGHEFVTVEAHPSQLADAREMKCAIRTIDRRIALWKRNRSIAADQRPARIVAAEHALTETRVRQIRAAAIAGKL